MAKTNVPLSGLPRQRLGGVTRRLGQWRWPIAALAAVLLVGAAYLLYDRVLAAPPSVVAPTAVTASRGNLQVSVNSTGTVAPLSTSRLAFGTSARVAEVNVKVGDAVGKGQPLAKLEVADLQLQVAQQKAALSAAQAKLATLKAGSRAEDVRAAQLQLDAAKGKLEAMLAGGRAEDVASAQAALESARAKLDQLESSPTESDLKAAEQSVVTAQSAVQKAESDLSKLKDGPTAEDLRAAELPVDQAKNSLWSQQLSRDGTCGNPRSAQFQCDSANASVASAETALTIAQNSLAKLKLPPTSEELAAAELAVGSARAQLSSAQTNLDKVKAGPSADDLAVAQAEVTQAEQALLLKQRPYTEADVQAQRQAVAQAEAGLVAKQVPYTAADLLLAQASVDQAQAQLALAQANVDRAVLAAPFDGVVNAVAFNPGEQASSSSTLTIVDPKSLRLDVTVDESDVAKVAVGQKSSMTFDAIPGRAFAGQVTAVAPNATLQSGVATYLVSISIPEPGPVKPGMTGNANVVYAERTSVLLVPNRAIRSQGRSRVVDVLVGGQRETRTVKVGVGNDQMSEITEGVSEGEAIVIPSTASSVPRAGAPSGGAFIAAPAPKPVGP